MRALSNAGASASAADRAAAALIVVAALISTGLMASLAGAAKDETTLVSRVSASEGGAGADNVSSEPAITPGGRYVAFTSHSDNLSGADNNAYQNVFLRDTQTESTILVSRRSAAEGGAGANEDSYEPSISADGRYIAFRSEADNLSTVDDNDFSNVFVRDTQANVTTLISRESAADGGQPADDGSFEGTISADGRYVAFSSDATNLSAADLDAPRDIFVRDTQTNETVLASRRSAAEGGAGASDTSSVPEISADGRHVAFASSANNLSTADDDDFTNIFVRDTQAATTTLVTRQSAADGGAGADSFSSTPHISADGRHVAFSSDADNLSGSDGPSIDVFVRDMQAETTVLVSLQSAGDGGAAANGTASGGLAISADGRYAVFRSDANNLSAADNDSFDNVFVRDTQASATTLVSRQSATDGGAGADGPSRDAAISADGRYVAFTSEADNLSALDSNGIRDIFLRDVLGDTDPPGLGLSGKKRQKLGKPVKVKASCDEACTVVVKGTVKPQGNARATGPTKRAEKLKLKRAEKDLAAGETKVLKLKLPKRTARKLADAAKAKAQLSATATDEAGNAASAKLKLKLR